MTTALSRIVTPAGHEAWMVTDYATVRSLLGDARLGLSHPCPAEAARLSDSLVFGRPLQRDDEEVADHARMRRLLARRFSARRLEAMRPWMRARVDEVLDGLEAAGSPADFHELVSFPLPALVICDLLGVPFEHREQFRRWSDQAADMHDARRSRDGLQLLAGYIRGLVDDRMAEPRADLLSELVEAHRAEPDAFTLDKVAALGMTILFAGHETTVTAIDTGALLLGSHPAQRDALRHDPAGIPAAVEEILRGSLPRTRLFAPMDPHDIGGALPRWAVTDLVVGGEQVHAGDMLLLGLAHANADPLLVGTTPDFDARRDPNPHVTFGHGAHFCAGAPLARMELCELFEAVVRRFPRLTTVVSADEMSSRDDLLTGGMEHLPVTW